MYVEDLDLTSILEYILEVQLLQSLKTMFGNLDLKKKKSICVLATTMAYVWRSEDNLVFPSTMWVQGSVSGPYGGRR